MEQSKKYFLPLCLILLIFLLMGFINGDEPLSKKELKKLEKAKLLNQEAKGLKNRADSLYLKIELFEASSYPDSKKIKKLESRAVDLEIQAVILEEEAYLLENSIYDKSKPHLKLEVVNNNEKVLKLKLLEEIAEDFFINAENYKKELQELKVKKDSSSNDINRVDQIGTSDIKEQKELINVYIGDEIIRLQDQTSLYIITDSNEVVLNEELLNVFLFNVNNKDSVISFDVFRELFYSDTLKLTTMRSAWSKYLQGSIVINDSSEIISELPSKVETVIKDEQIEDEKKLAEGIIFKVQIAADIVVLSSEKLSTIYKGNKKIVPFEQDEWFKYAVGNFKTYQEANKYREICGVGDAFVIAFNGKEKMDVLVAKRILRKLNQSNTNLVISKSK